MDDITTYAVLISSAFFTALSVGLLYRYRQVSRQISASNDIGKALFQALDSTLRRQDGRILDMMGRVEVIQARSLKNQDQPRVGSGTALRGEGNPDAREVDVGTSGSSYASSSDKSRLGVTAADMSQAASHEVVPDPTALDPQTSGEILKLLETKMKAQDERLLRVMGSLDAIQFALKEKEARASAIVQPSILPSQGRRDQQRNVGDKVSESDLFAMLNESPRTSVEIRERFGISREHAARVLKGLFDKNFVVRNETQKPFVYELTDEGRLKFRAD